MIESIAEDAFEMFRFFPHVQDWPLEFAPFLSAFFPCWAGRIECRSW